MKEREILELDVVPCAEQASWLADVGLPFLRKPSIEILVRFWLVGMCLGISNSILGPEPFNRTNVNLPK